MRFDLRFAHLFCDNVMKSVCFCADAELSIDEKYKKTLEEIEALKDHLGTTANRTICGHGTS